MDAPKLNALRQEIDAIDGNLHGLIRRRASLVGEITASKPPGGLALRPGREIFLDRFDNLACRGILPLDTPSKNFVKCLFLPAKTLRVCRVLLA